VELEGHIADSGTMGRCFGLVVDLGGEFEVEAFDIGRHKQEESYCRLRVSAPDEERLRSILHEHHQNGANLSDPVDATLDPAPADRLVPTGFYSTTNHPTQVRYEGDWLEVERIEVDCAVVVDPDGPWAYTATLNAVQASDPVVTGEVGVRVDPPDRPRDSGGPFGFMRGGVSSERPSRSLIERVAEALVETKAEGGRILVVAGPAVIHSGAGGALARLVQRGTSTPSARATASPSTTSNAPSTARRSA